MSPTVKKLEVADLGDLETLVAENIEGIEPGLRVVDSRLFLGPVVINLVALDAGESLVLVALDFTADKGLLLRVIDAYSWCLEYPDTLRRLYPMANVSATRPPRILIIVERLTDTFVQRIKQLSVLELDCLEIRYLEVNGTSAVYFDLVERLRRAAPVEQVAPAAVEPAAPTTTPPAWMKPSADKVVQPSNGRMSFFAHAAKGTAPMSVEPVKSILVVDADPVVARLLEIILKGDGHRVTIARNGVEVLALLANQAFDLLLVDIQTPEIDGLALCHELERRHPEHAGRVMFMAGGAVEAETAEVLSPTRTPLLRKPLEVKEFRATVQQFFLAADSVRRRG